MEDSTNNQSLKKESIKDFVYKDKVATPSGEASIETMKVGNPVLAFSARSESGKIILSSAGAKVSFSIGINDYHSTVYMVYINLEQGNMQDGIVCTLDQPFLLANGKYTTAQNLHQGQSLVDKDGNAVKIVQVGIGQYRGGIQGISTDIPGFGPDGHLLLCNGVIMGDYAFQIGFHTLSQDLKEIE